MYYCSSLAVGPCLAATARAYLVEAVGVEAGFEKEGQPYAVSATGARAQRRRGAWDKSWSGPIHVATLAMSRDTCEWFISGGRCRAASRSGPARAREHGMSRVGVGWSLTMRAWATAAHWLEANPKGINQRCHLARVATKAARTARGPRSQSPRCRWPAASRRRCQGAPSPSSSVVCESLFARAGGVAMYLY